MTDPTGTDPFMAEMRRIVELVPGSQKVARDRGDAMRRSEEMATSRLEAAMAMAESHRRWAEKQLNHVTAAVADGSGHVPSEVDQNISPQPQSLLADARAGLQDVANRAQISRDGIREGGRNLLIWKARKSSIVGGIAIALAVLVLLLGIFVARRILANNADANATPTIAVIAGVTRVPDEPDAAQDMPTPDNGEAESTPSPGNGVSVASPAPRSSVTSTPTPRPTPTKPSPTRAATDEPIVESLQIGRTAGGNSIEAVRFGNGNRAIVFVGGMHAGFAPGTVALAREAVSHFTGNLNDIPEDVTLYIVISASPDTSHAPGELAGRLNHNRVDVNRNWGCRWTTDARFRGEVIPGSGGKSEFSEPEAIALRDFILDRGAIGVVFWEAKAEGGLVSPGNCGSRTEVSSRLGNTYGKAAGYRVADFENLTNQELNGDSTNWLDSIGIPAISVLLPSYETTDWSANLKGMLAVLEAFGG